MDNTEASSEQITTVQQANQASEANRIAIPRAQRKSRAIAATQNASRASRRRRSCSWASRHR